MREIISAAFDFAALDASSFPSVERNNLALKLCRLPHPLYHRSVHSISRFILSVRAQCGRGSLPTAHPDFHHCSFPEVTRLSSGKAEQLYAPG